MTLPTLPNINYENWREFTIAPEGTHHLYQGNPVYAARFISVLAFHAPGLAPVQDATGAYHINPNGEPVYDQRYQRTFGFYQGKASVKSQSGWFHIGITGDRLYHHSFAWCGNFQEHRCVVRDFNGQHFHIKDDGTPAYAERYAYVGDFRDGFAVVQRPDGLHTHINSTGKLVHKRWFLDLDVFHKGYARSRDERGWFHINCQGIAAYNRRFAAVEPFYNGQSRVEDFDGSLWLIDETGESITQLRSPRKDLCAEVSADLVSYWRSHTLKSAVELRVFEVLPAAKVECDRLFGVAPGMGDRLLKALGELGYVYQTNNQTWDLTAKGLLLKPSHLPSLAEAARLWGEEHYQAWTHLTEALISGNSPFNAQFNENFFDWLDGQPEKLTNYHQALANYAKSDYESIVNLIDFSQYHTVLDAGGGTGELLFLIVRSIVRSDSCQGILLERPQVIAQIQIPDELQGIIQLCSGDIFEPWLVKADAIILAKVLHDWPDRQAEMILKQARLSLNPAGTLYIIERLLSAESYNGGMLDLNMLVMTGSRERNFSEFQGLLNQAGFEMSQKIDLTSGLSIIVSG